MLWTFSAIMILYTNKSTRNKCVINRKLREVDLVASLTPSFIFHPRLFTPPTKAASLSKAGNFSELRCSKPKEISFSSKPELRNPQKNKTPNCMRQNQISNHHSKTLSPWTTAPFVSANCSSMPIATNRCRKTSASLSGRLMEVQMPCLVAFKLNPLQNKRPGIPSTKYPLWRIKASDLIAFSQTSMICHWCWAPADQKPYNRMHSGSSLSSTKSTPASKQRNEWCKSIENRKTNLNHVSGKPANRRGKT